MTLIIDDLSNAPYRTRLGTSWQLVSDRVMGGVSRGQMSVEEVAGRKALRMKGEVSLENNGGFLQLALALSPDGQAVDASAWDGLEIDVIGNGSSYNMHLRTSDIRRPWQSYRQSFEAGAEWQTVRLPFAGFEAYRIDAPLNVARLRRLGLVAIGRAFEADVALGGLRLYR